MISEATRACIEKYTLSKNNILATVEALNQGKSIEEKQQAYLQDNCCKDLQYFAADMVYSPKPRYDLLSYMIESFKNTGYGHIVSQTEVALQKQLPRTLGLSPLLNIFASTHRRNARQIKRIFKDAPAYRN